jgi:hypothetical protein
MIIREKAFLCWRLQLVLFAVAVVELGVVKDGRTFRF